MTDQEKRISLAPNRRAARRLLRVDPPRRSSAVSFPLCRAQVRVRLVALVVGLVITGTSFLPTAAVEASPIDDKKAEAARIADEVTSLGVQVELLGEELAEAETEVADLTESVAAAEARLAETAAATKSVQDEVRDRAVESYVRGGDLATADDLAGAGGDSAVAETYLESINGNRQDTLDQLRALRLDESARRSELEATEAEATRARDAVAQRKLDVATLLAQRTEIRKQIDGELATLIAEEQRRRADEEAKRVRDELARQAAAARQVQSRPRASGPKVVEPPAGTDVPAPNPQASVAVATAKAQLGKPYLWGSGGPNSFDCSGLTSFAWAAAGVTLPRTSRSQYAGTVRVAVADIQPGDLVFFGSPIHHVGIYVGGGQMVNAPESGDVVKYSSIYRSDIVGVGRVD